MATEKRMIDPKLLLEDLGEEPYIWNDTDKEIQEHSDWLRFKEMIEQQPTVDAVEVVRCEECLYRSQYFDKNGMYHCGGIDTTKYHVLPVVAPDFFCAHGERRVNENC